MVDESAVRAVVAMARKRVRNPEQMDRWGEACEARDGETRDEREERLDRAHLSIFGSPREKSGRPAPQQQELGFGLDDENDPVPF